MRRKTEFESLVDLERDELGQDIPAQDTLHE